MRTSCEMGLWPAQPPTGYRKVDGRLAKCEVEIDPDRADIIKQIFEKIAYEKWSASKVHAWLKYDLRFPYITWLSLKYWERVQDH
jgi:hypothetical protein